MPSISETGHAKNVANFMQLVSFVQDYGPDYKPTRDSIKLPNLKTKAKAAETAVAAVNAALVSYDNAIGDREAAFSQLPKLGTRMVNALKATEATSQIIASMVSFNKKLQGTRVSAVLTDEELKAKQAARGKAVKQVSASQQSFDNRLDTFDKMVKLLESIPYYDPNETELKAATLTVLYNTLKANNATVAAATTLLSNARVKRNLTMYDPESGLPATAQDVKSYVKSVYGASNPAYKQIASLTINKITI